MCGRARNSGSELLSESSPSTPAAQLEVSVEKKIKENEEKSKKMKENERK